MIRGNLIDKENPIYQDENPSDDILQDYLENIDLSNLSDIRDSKSYRDFVTYIGGLPTNMDTNGYDILAKDYKRELKYAAGNLMQLLLRPFIDRSI